MFYPLDAGNKAMPSRPQYGAVQKSLQIKSPASHNLSG